MIRTISLKKLITSILLPLFTGLLANIFTSNAKAVYSNLLKPPVSPPSIVFPFIWTLLYILIGISIYLVEDSYCDKKRSRQSYAVLLGLNLLWPIIFFTLQWYAVAVVIIFLMLASAVISIYYFYNCDKNAGFLLLPYLIWLVYSTYLNIGVVALN